MKILVFFCKWLGQSFLDTDIHNNIKILSFYCSSGLLVSNCTDLNWGFWTLVSLYWAGWRSAMVIKGHYEEISCHLDRSILKLTMAKLAFPKTSWVQVTSHSLLILGQGFLPTFGRDVKICRMFSEGQCTRSHWYKCQTSVETYTISHIKSQASDSWPEIIHRGSPLC